MYEPLWQFGRFCGVRLGDTSIPNTPINRYYRTFLSWLQDQGKTLDQWLAEHPYVPPPPDPDTVETQRQIQWVRDNWASLTAREKLIIKLMARRVFPELKDLV